VRETRFVWLKKKKMIKHQFKKIGKMVQYGVEISSYVKQYKMKKVIRVKRKGLLLWIIIFVMSIDDPLMIHLVVL
jgi:hypothetical protein